MLCMPLIIHRKHSFIDQYQYYPSKQDKHIIIDIKITSIEYFMSIFKLEWSIKINKPVALLLTQ